MRRTAHVRAVWPLRAQGSSVRPLD